METVACNLCGSLRYKILYDLPDFYLGKDEFKTTIVRCLDCGLTYRNPRPTENELMEFYPPAYEPFITDDGDRSFISSKAANYGLKKRAEVIQKYKHEGSLLDIGCATGSFLKYLTQFPSWDLFGIEVNPYAAEIARGEYGLNVFTGTLENAGFGDQTLDVVTLWDVLEHMQDPLGTLKEISKILKPGGILAFRVPNGDSIETKIFGPYWSGFDSPRHLYVFTRASLRKMLEKGGFEVVEMSSERGSYLGVILSIRFIMSAKKWNAKIISLVTNVLQSPVARIIFSPFFYFYGLAQQSLQLWVVATVKK